MVSGRCYLLFTLCVFIAGQAVLGQRDESFEARNPRAGRWKELQRPVAGRKHTVCLKKGVSSANHISSSLFKSLQLGLFFEPPMCFYRAFPDSISEKPGVDHPPKGERDCLRKLRDVCGTCGTEPLGTLGRHDP